jgi:hypothetical protein
MPKEDKKTVSVESDDIEEQSSEVCQDCNKPLAKCECRDTKDNDDDSFEDDEDFGIED